jgi:hypothetical protein
MAGLIHPGDSLLLQTDCQSTILAIEGKRTSITPDEVAVVLDLLKLVTELRLTVTMRHVKGHTNGKTPRTWINNKCDELAGIERRKADQLLRKAKQPQQTTEDLGPPWD